MTILVTGAQGYLGRYVVAQLLRAGHTVVGVGRSARTDHYFSHTITWADEEFAAPLPLSLIPASPNHAYRYERCDLADPAAASALIDYVRPGLVIHLAAALRDDPLPQLLSANVGTVFNLCRALSTMSDSCRLILGSSGSVYGSSVSAVAETAKTRPIGHYAESKRIGEMVAERIAADHGLSLAILRIFNLVGPGLQQRHLLGLVAHAIAAIENGHRDAQITIGDLGASRDFIDVRDVAAFILALPSQATGIINVATGEAIVCRDAVRRLLARSDRTIKLDHAPKLNRPGGDELFADIGRMRRYFSPRYRLAQSLQDMLDYARATDPA